jgi:hypothetical protein
LLSNLNLDYSPEKGKELMDPITTAIVAALSVGVMSGLTDTGKQLILDTYDGLKALLKKKFGSQSEVVKSVENFEARPASQSRQGMLQEEVEAVKADQDPDLLQAAYTLLNQIRAQPGGEQHIQNAIGSYIVQADRGSTASINVNHPREEL